MTLSLEVKLNKNKSTVLWSGIFAPLAHNFKGTLWEAPSTLTQYTRLKPTLRQSAFCWRMIAREYKYRIFGLHCLYLIRISWFPGDLQASWTRGRSQYEGYRCKKRKVLIHPLCVKPNLICLFLVYKKLHLSVIKITNWPQLPLHVM